MVADSYQELDVWKRSIGLTVSVYELCKKFPNEEQYAPSEQMKRAAISVPSNIAEGQKRITSKDTIHFTSISLGSLTELETQLIIVEKIYNFEVKQILEECTIISRMIHALIKSLQRSRDA